MEALREMTYDFHPEAEEEFLSAINYYEESHIGLGHDFAQEVYSAIQSIIEHPKTWPVFHLDVRRRLIGRPAHSPAEPSGRPLPRSGEDWMMSAG